MMCAGLDSSLPPHPRLVFVALSRWADEDARAYRSVPRLMHDTGLSESSVYRALARLRGTKWIRQVGTTAKGATLYALTPVRGTPLSERHPVRETEPPCQGDRGPPVRVTPEKKRGEEEGEEEPPPYPPEGGTLLAWVEQEACRLAEQTALEWPGEEGLAGDLVDEFRQGHRRELLACRHDQFLNAAAGVLGLRRTRRGRLRAAALLNQLLETA